MSELTVAVDNRPRVRLWSRKYFKLIDEGRVPDGERPIDTVRTLLRRSGLTEAVATIHRREGRYWLGFAYLDGRHVNVINYEEFKKKL